MWTPTKTEQRSPSVAKGLSPDQPSCYMLKGPMSDREREAAFVPGPLDELVPGLRKKLERLPPLPVHPRVVRARKHDGSTSMVLLSFRPAQSARAFHAALKPMVEAALLSELCAPANLLGADYAPLTDLTLLCFADHSLDLGSALTPFGLTPAELSGPDAAHLLALARREARTLAEPVPDEPVAAFRARVIRSPHPLANTLHEALLEYAPHQPWGKSPGLLARTAADWLATQVGFDGVGPTRAGIERLESLLVHAEPGAIRWIDPLSFQALCDLVGVLAASQQALRVEWGVCEVDADGVAPPPVLRVQRDDDTFHVPLGEHVLRWCVMPVQAHEDVPSLGAWAEHEFA